VGRHGIVGGGKHSSFDIVKLSCIGFRGEEIFVMDFIVGGGGVGRHIPLSIRGVTGGTFVKKHKSHPTRIPGGIVHIDLNIGIGLGAQVIGFAGHKGNEESGKNKVT
jgi:hypothetical protein